MRFGMGLAIFLTSAGVAAADPVPQGPKNVPEFEPAWPLQTRAPAVDSGITLRVDVVAGGLSHPWGIAVLPDGSYLVTERDGNLRHVANGKVSAPITGVPEVVAQRQGGLLDVTIAPDFATSGVVYLTYAKPMPRGMNATAAGRAVLNAERTALTGFQDIFVQDPPSPTPMHFGSRIVVQGEHAFVTTGEHSSRRERQYAQDIGKTYGKVIRVRLDGAAAPGNPFASAGPVAAQVWTLGHRNVQGADLHPDTGALWTLEHGPRGGDELNLIEVGANYGWPVVSYGENYGGSPVGSGKARAEGFVEPRYYWDPVIAPGGFAFYDGSLIEGWHGNVLAASLNPGGLVRLVLDGDRVVGEERFLAGERRIRDVEIDRDGAILLLDDGEGEILRLTPQ